MNHRLLLKGTLFLVIAGFSSRFIGFFYRIYLSNILGPKNLGIYQLIFPIYNICYAIYAAGIQTAISQIVASKISCKNKNSQIIAPFFTGASISLFLSLILSCFLYKLAPIISTYILKESQCTTPLQILSLIFPFCGLTACINGFYYAIKKTGIPAISQLIEQIFRVGLVFILFSMFNIHNTSCEIAVIGLVFGEFISCIYMLIALGYNKNFHNCIRLNKSANLKLTDYFYSYHNLISYTLPLTLNKLTINILSSVESILIPIMLVKYGLSHNNSLSTYGILTGMSMSFIMFPSTITNSLSVVLLPTISEANAQHRKEEITDTVSKTLHYSLIIGLLSFSLFALWGKDIGTIIYHNKSAGLFIRTLAPLCPFMYITTTFSSILNGLGKTSITFRNSIISVFIKLFFIIFVVPKVGINGYLFGMLTSTICVCLLDLFSLKKYISIKINFLNSIIKPVIILITTGLIVYNLYKYIIFTYHISQFLILVIACFTFTVTYTIFMISKEHR